MAFYEVGHIAGVTHTSVDAEMWRGSGMESSFVRTCCRDMPRLPLGSAVRAMSSSMHTNVFQTIWAIFHSVPKTHYIIHVLSSRNTIDTPTRLRAEWMGWGWGDLRSMLFFLSCRFLSQPVKTVMQNISSPLQGIQDKVECFICSKKVLYVIKYVLNNVDAK